ASSPTLDSPPGTGASTRPSSLGRTNARVASGHISGVLLLRPSKRHRCVEDRGSGLVECRPCPSTDRNFDGGSAHPSAALRARERPTETAPRRYSSPEAGEFLSPVAGRRAPEG